MGWFQICKTSVLLATVALSATFVSQSWALNIDFEKELKKREIVSVRLAGDIESRAEQDQNPQTSSAQASIPHASNPQPAQEELDLNPDRESETFTVQLKPIRR